MTTKSNYKNENKFDAIVIGSGMSGGIAAKELSQSGLKTLVLERGRDVKHIKDYPSMNKAPWELPYADQLTARERKHYDKQLRTGLYNCQPEKYNYYLHRSGQPLDEVDFSNEKNSKQLDMEFGFENACEGMCGV